MERSTPVRKTHASTADLLTWSETPLPADPPAPDSSARRSHMPSSGISPALFGGQMTEEEVESVNKRNEAELSDLFPLCCVVTHWFLIIEACRTDELMLMLMLSKSYDGGKPCSGPKLKEMTGSGIFGVDNEDGVSESGSSLTNSSSRTCVRIYQILDFLPSNESAMLKFDTLFLQQATSGISQISFSAEEGVSPKKPTSLPEVAKQRELSGTLESEADAKVKKQPSDAKNKELSGHDIFGPPPENPPRPLAARNLELKGQLDFGEPTPRSIHTSVKVSNPAGGQSNIMLSEEPVEKTAKKIHNQKFQELTGNDIFKGDTAPTSAEKPLSSAKLKEMSGNDIFADVKAASRDYFGGVRKPPGGGSSIALV
ncbi:hypothetical protein IEQ34_015637 [Dendrobium chrysotoxum]|uniref:DUF4057 domain-containing protein n=1 Tax=Dendrobium chrysotoxum TaxID=161865 RepID=A0AAV7GH86_DENCH|nr:hypothetical protein IEQ34_015637 [Dendrobium chrysotoxum]